MTGTKSEQVTSRRVRGRKKRRADGTLPPGPAPAVELTEQFIHACGELQMTHEEIGKLFGVYHSTITKALKRDPILGHAYEAGKASGQMSVRRAQFLNATIGMNTVMQIWWGKQYLDQRDAPHTIDQNVNVEIRYVAEWGGGALPAGEDEEVLELEATEVEALELEEGESGTEEE